MGHLSFSAIAGTPKRVVASASCVGLAVFTGHFVWAMYQPRHLPYWLLAAFGSAIAAAIVAALTAVGLWVYCRRQQEIASRTFDIVQLNHDIRNSLQVIAYLHENLPERDARVARNALVRIEQALRTISDAGNQRRPAETDGAVRRQKSTGA